MASGGESSRYFVKSLERSLAIMRVFDEQTPAMTLSEAARRAGVTRASARRILLSLVDLGYVGQKGSLFNLRPKVLELGRSYLASQGLSMRAQPLLEALSSEIHDPASLAVLDGGDIVYIARATVSRLLTISVGVGSRLPAHVTALGRVLLAELPDPLLNQFLETGHLKSYTPSSVVSAPELRSLLIQVRARQFSYVDEELEVGLRAIAVPVRNGLGAVVAAVGVSAYAGRVSRKAMLEDILPKLRTLADTLSADAR